MCGLKNIEQNTKLTDKLIALKKFDKDKFVIIDVGARGGFEGYWRKYEDQAQILGFEPDKKECARLNRKNKNASNKFYPIALSKKSGKRKFYVTNYPASSGFYKPDMEFYKRLPDAKNLAIKKNITVKTTDLDSFLKKEGINKVDFIKLDIEGAELDVLEGAKDILKNSVFGLSIEVAFQPLHKGRAVFSQIDSFLTLLGFTFFDLSINRYARKSLSPNLFLNTTSATQFGQALIGQAVYLKDAVAEISKKNLREKWDEIRVLKLASLMEVFKLQDCATELLQKAIKQGILKSDQHQTYIDLLTPSMAGLKPSYNQYIAYLKSLSSKQLDEQQRLISYNRLLSPFKKLVPLPFRKIIFKVLLFFRNSLDLLIKSN